jgi:hypothetical protein
MWFVSCSNAPFEFYDPASPIYTSPRFLPPAKIEEGCSISVSRGLTQAAYRGFLVVCSEFLLHGYSDTYM